MSRLLISRSEGFPEGRISVKIWGVPKSKAFPQGIKYRMALIFKGKRILGYDNSSLESHHKHSCGEKEKINIRTARQILSLYYRFMSECEELMKKWEVIEND